MQTQNNNQNSTLRKVPTLSLGSYTKGNESEKARFVEQLYSGMKDYGFIVLKHHDVSSDILKQAYQILEKFYGLPVEKKRSYISELGGGQRGYTPFGK